MRKATMRTALLLSLGLVLAPSLAGASSDDAWATMRKSVETACLKAATGHFSKASAIVDPFGSESFGLAFLRGPAKGGTQTVQMICVYDKKTGKVELGSELPAR